MGSSDSDSCVELERRTRFETLLIDLSSRFINLPAERVDSAIEGAQRWICEYLDLDRSALWQQPLTEPNVLRLTHVYQRSCAPAVPAEGDGQALFPWSVRQLQRGETILFGDLDSLPPEASRDKESWRRFGTKSSAVVPLSIGGVGFGGLSFDCVRERRDWSETLLRQLQLVAQVFSSALARARSDKELRESRDRYALAVEGANDGLWDWDIPTGEVYLSPRWKAMLGYEDHEVPNTIAAWEALLHPNDRDAALSVLQAHLAGRTSVYEMEHRLRSKDGGYRWVLARGKALRDAEGHPYRMAGSHSDINERKRAEEALRQRNQYIEAVLEQAPIGFAVHTIDDGVGRFVSARYEEIYGVPRGTIASHYDFFDKVWLHDPEFKEQIRRCVVADIASGDASRMRWENVPVKLASGETRYITAANIPLFEENLMVSTVQDVTERVRAENGLRESVLRFQQVAEATNGFIWEVDAEGLYTYTSPSVEKILGYAPEELVGKTHFYDLFAPDVRADLRAAAFRVFDARAPFKAFSNLNVSKDGRMVHLETSGVPLLDDTGDLVGYRGADTDVTERKEAEERLRRAYEQLKELRDQLEQQNVCLRQEVETLHGHARVIGQSRALQRVLMQAEQVAATASTVLLLGETGTGKELIASVIHEMSPRRDHVMVRVNCSAIPASLIESELFGREKGAYTGALSRQAGRFEMAQKSTLFLDEIGDLPFDVQVKLLRVLQERQIERLGSPKPIHVDVRIVAATNQDLGKAVREGRFRQDLYYRLNVFPITVPPLRERREDIPPLVSAFVAEFAAAFGKNIESIDRESMETVQRYHWPGNVRELRNVIERAMIVAKGPRLYIDLPDASASAPMPCLTMRGNEQQLILSVLDMTGWRIRGRNGAAEILGLKPTTLESRMAKLGIRRRVRDATK